MKTITIGAIHSPTENNKIEPLTYKQKIESLRDEWYKISSCKQWDKWANKVSNTNFGTYGTLKIEDVINNTGVQFINRFVKDSFINEFKDAKNGLKQS